MEPVQRKPGFGSRVRRCGRQTPWPLVTTPDVAEDVEFELAESLSMALMLVLKTLSSTDRAVLVLREVFSVGSDETAAAVDRRPTAVRRITTAPAGTSMPGARATGSPRTRAGRSFRAAAVKVGDRTRTPTPMASWLAEGAADSQGGRPMSGSLLLRVQVECDVRGERVKEVPGVEDLAGGGDADGLGAAGQDAFEGLGD